MATNDALVQGLRDLADFMEQNPHLNWSDREHYTASTTADVMVIINERDDFAAFAATPGGWTKRGYGGDNGNFEIARKFGPVKLQVVTQRNEVCERKVVGIETVEVPDPDAPLVTVEREVVEWDCKPILSVTA